jgi:hypothetical protein
MESRPTSIVSCSILLCLLTACETMPKDAFRLSESALETRAVQTRSYSSIDDTQILSASMAVLQDMGYTVDEIEKDLGLLSASKRADATNDLAALGSIAADTLKCVVTLGLGCTGGNYADIDDIQDIRLTLVTQPQRDNAGEISVRVTMQRIIWAKNGALSEQETISDGNVYVAFFDKLSTAVFLEQEGL